MAPRKLLDLTPELVQAILTKLDPTDVAACSETCRTLREYQDPDSNPLLWKALFLSLFDPIEGVGLIRAGLPLSQAQRAKRAGRKIDYARVVKERCRARGVVHSPHAAKKASNRAEVLKILTDILETGSGKDEIPGSSKNALFLTKLFQSKSDVADWLNVAPAPPHVVDSEGDVVPHPSVSEISEEQRKLNAMSCKLHLAGISLTEISWDGYAAGRGYREMVYRGTNFSEDNGFGPFRIDNEEEGNPKLAPDYTLLDAISRSMSLSVRSAWHQWAAPEAMEALPYGFEKAILWKQPGPGRDWANVEGKWSYLYAFTDYSDFFAFNFSAPRGPERVINTLEGVSEAVGGLNTLDLQLIPEDTAPPPDEDDDPDYPRLYFIGTSTGPNAATFRGTVKLLDDGTRHWTFVIRYGGSDRWLTEAVEFGSRGIYGMWSDVTHEELSPCGPVWYFRET